MNSIVTIILFTTALIAAIFATESLEDKARIQDSMRFLQRLADTRRDVASLKDNIVSLDGDLLHQQFLQRLADTRRDVASLKDNIVSLDGDLLHQQKRTCNVGLNSNSCKTMAVDNAMNALDWMSNGYSPGKRSAEKPIRATKTEEMLREIIRRRQSMQTLKSLLDQAENHILRESKRTCRMNLGGHCQTELASAIAEQWHYLNSPISPGRKRRDTRRIGRILAL